MWWLRRRYRPARIEELRIDAAGTSDALPAAPGLRIDAVQSPTRHDAEARKRDSA
jgi:hypothetical protein